MSVEILVGGVDQYPVVHFPTLRFVSKVNGVAGEALIRIRDEDANKTFTPGQPVILRVDGENVWRGFVTVVQRPYIADAYNVAQMGPTRFIDLHCVDVNILLSRRIVFNQSDPDDVLAPLYAPGTPDTTAIADLVADWLDLSGDGIDTSSLVENVGDINVDQPARAWSGSYEWGQAMASIASLPAAIFYIDPDLNLVYTDVDTPNAPYAMSDVPSPGSVGYREMEIMQDGGGLANDVLAWGLGYGSQTPVFVRDQDAASQAIHGRWQVGEQRNGVYKQATINRIAQSIIDGSPQSKRGAKNDKVAVTLSTYTPGFLPAQKIDFTSEVWDFTDVIPIREMEVTFEAPQNPKYTLTLSHEIDAQWGFIDQFIPRFGLPGINLHPPLPPGFPFPPTDGCPPSICGITDSWQRLTDPVMNSGATTTGQFAGASDAGPLWDVELQRGAGCEVGDDLLLYSFRVTSSTGFGSSGLVLPWPSQEPDSVTTYTTRFTPNFLTASIDPGDYDVVDLHFGASGDSSLGPDVVIRLNPSGSVLLGSRITVTGGSATTIPDNWWTNATDYYVTITYGPSGTVAEVTDGTTTYQASSGTMLNSINNPYLSLIRTINIKTGNHNDLWFAYGDLAITGVNRCTAVQFDDFEREVSGGWGTSTDGHVWTDLGQVSGLGTSSLDVNGWGSIGVRNVSPSLSTTRVVQAVSPAPWTDGVSWTLSTKFFMGSVSIMGMIVRRPDNSASVYFNVNRAADTVSGTDNVDVPFTFITAWYNLKWEVVYGASDRFKVWQDGDPEPSSWTVTNSPPTILQSDTLQLQVFGRVDVWDNQQFIDFEYIDFDYPGRPCYLTEDCTNALFDEFERDVDPGWGTADSGQAWSAGAGSSGDALTFEFDTDLWVGEMLVSSANASMSQEVSVSLSGSITALTKFHSNRDGGDIVALGGLAINQMIVGAMTAQRTSAVAQTIGVAAEWRRGSSVGNGSDPVAQLQFFRQESSVLEHVDSPISFNSGTWYYLKMEAVPGTPLRAKVWEDGDPEPSTWVESTIETPEATYETFSLAGKSQSGSSAQMFVDFEMVDVVACSVTSVPQESTTAPTDTTGRGCVNGARVSEFTYQVPNAYMPLSTLVYLDGVLQRRGVDYTESLPYSVVFDDSVSSTSTVRICYYPLEGPP